MRKRNFLTYMLKRSLTLAAAIMLLLALAVPAAAATGPATVPSESYLVMDADTGQILLSKNADEELAPASVTKIMTLGLACQKANGDWTTELTVSHDDVHTLYGTDSSHIALAEGEVVTLEQLLYATAMASANDASNVLAEYIGGTIQGGVDAMNAQAAALGLEHTHFVNPHGISVDGHYTSAGDLAVILQWAVQQPGFTQLFDDTNMYTMPGNPVHPETRYFCIQDAMRRQSSYYYIPEITGSKIGYTDIARYTYACTAEKDGVRLICTVMKSDLKTDKYADVKTLLDYAFSRFRRVEIPEGQTTETITVEGGGDTLGTLEAATPGISLLLDTALDESALSVEHTEATYILGGSVPMAAYSVSGQGIQEDAVIYRPVSLAGLSALLDSAPQEHLPAEKAEAKLNAGAGLNIPLWMLLLAAAGCVIFLAVRASRVQDAKRRKRLRKAPK
jgi:D-alanyl-D-alanine carboxypeptidase (penicillin-binding protein 5/6)